jgi:hypothetical protein
VSVGFLLPCILFVVWLLILMNSLLDSYMPQLISDKSVLLATPYVKKSLTIFIWYVTNNWSPYEVLHTALEVEWKKNRDGFPLLIHRHKLWKYTVWCIVCLQPSVFYFASASVPVLQQSYTTNELVVFFVVTAPQVVISWAIASQSHWMFAADPLHLSQMQLSDNPIFKSALSDDNVL